MFNKAGKTFSIFIVLIIILLVCSTSIGFYLYHLEQGLHRKDRSELDSSQASEQKLQAQLKDIQSQLALSEDKNKEADQKINNLLDEQDLNEGLRTALKNENAKLKAQIEDTERSKDKIKSDLDDSVAKISQFQQLLKASEDKGKALEDRLAVLTETNKGLQANLDALKANAQGASSGQGGKNKVELDKIVVNPQNSTKGHVLSIDTDAEFVIFNLGLKQGIKPDQMLSIYRGEEYLGDVKATRVQDEMSAADIIPPLSSREIRKNDTVVIKP